MTTKGRKIEIKGKEIGITRDDKEDFICLTDIARHKNPEATGLVISHRLRNRNTVEFLDISGRRHNPDFNYGEFATIKSSAASLESQLDELQCRWYSYTQRRWLRLSREFTQSTPAVYMHDFHQGGERHWNFILNNENTLKQIRGRHFLADWEPLRADTSSVTERAAQETARAEICLRETHADILKSFDPTVVSLKKKMKVVVAPAALDGLVDGDDGE